MSQNEPSAPESSIGSRQGGFVWWLARLPRRALLAAPDLLVAAICGTGVFLSFPRWDVYLLLIPALAVLWYRGAQVSRTRAFWMGLVAGTVTNIGGFYWVVGLLRDFTGMPDALNMLLYVLLCAQQGALFAVAMLLAKSVKGRAFEMPFVFALAFLVVDSWWPMIFKWYLGNSQYLNHAVAQLAELGGVPMVTAWVLAASAVVSAALLGWRRRGQGEAGPSVTRHWAVWTSLILFCGALWGALRMAQIDARQAAAPTHRIGLVEANVGIFEKTDPRLFRNNLLIHQNLSAELERQGVQLIVWPETAYMERDFVGTSEPVESLEQARARARLLGLLPRDIAWLPPSDAPLVASRDDDQRAGAPPQDTLPPQRGFRTPLLTGAVFVRMFTEEESMAAPPRGSGNRRSYGIYNSAMLLDADGRVLDVYDKNVLMPFSESVPLGRTLWNMFGINLYAVIPASGEMERGVPMEQAFELPAADGQSYRAGVLICYEDIMAHMNRLLVARTEPHVIINVTNDAWFGKTSEPYLHLALATFRAIESRRWLVRSTNTGVSCFVDANGRVVSETSLDDAETLIEDVPMMPPARTMFAMLGHWIVWVAALALLRLWWSFRRRAPEI